MHCQLLNSNSVFLFVLDHTSQKVKALKRAPDRFGEIIMALSYLITYFCLHLFFI
jgi:hypothetical protein